VLSVRSRLEYDGVARGGWSGDYMDPFTFLSMFTTAGGDNGTGWTDPAFVRILDAANRQTERQARYAALAVAETFLLDAQPVIPLYTNATNWLKKPYVKGLYANPVTMHAWKYVHIEHDPAQWGEN
jgi:oligopeptide transport system substrate-binding protein